VTEFVSDGYVLPCRPRNSPTVVKEVAAKTKGGRSVRTYFAISWFSRAHGYLSLQEKRIANNAHVVPYNPHLLVMFDSHTNVEMCGTVKACKYIFKYIFKVRFVFIT
jgi:hypothetical protein